MHWRAIVTATAALGAVLGPAGPAIGGTKNVVLVVADDLGLDLGCYGSPDVKTPHLDRLASRGTRFTRAYCTTSSCSASRSVLLTGLQNHATGHYGHEHAEHHFSTFDRLRGLPSLLNDAGYRTAIIGKLHLAPTEVYPFGRVLPHRTAGGSHNPVGMAEDSREFLAEAPDRPFFLYFCPTDPHRAGAGFANRPYPGVEPVLYNPATIALPAFLPDTPEARAEWAEYAQAASRFDQGVGRLMQILEETGHAEDTLVIVLSDNGPPFPGAKTTQYEPGTRLPLIVRAPDHPRPGLVTDAMVTWADVTPTILDFTGVAGPSYSLHGRSFIPVLGSEHPEGWDECFGSHTFHEVQMYYPMRVIRRGPHKLILNVAHPLPFPFASDLYASKTWQGALRRGLDRYGPRPVAEYLHRPRFELYDLAADPDEARNLAADPDHARLLDDLKARLLDFQRRTGDPWASKWVYE